MTIAVPLVLCYRVLFERYALIFWVKFYNKFVVRIFTFIPFNFSKFWCHLTPLNPIPIFINRRLLMKMHWILVTTLYQNLGCWFCCGISLEYFQIFTKHMSFLVNLIGYLIFYRARNMYSHLNCAQFKNKFKCTGWSKNVEHSR